jgi:hypothetical protein
MQLTGTHSVDDASGRDLHPASDRPTPSQPVRRARRRVRGDARDEPARLLELISPAGFENYFRELAPLLAATARDEAAIGEVVARYQLDIDFGTIPALAEQHRLRLA